MKEPNNQRAFEILCILIASDGRGDSLFGDDIKRLPERIAPFLSVDPFPSIHLEFPLLGRPYTDVTVLYRTVEPGTRMITPAAGDCSKLLEWYADVCRKYPKISFGFEMDSALGHSGAAFGFQPREAAELVRPYCEITETTEQGERYLRAAERMPEGWPLSFSEYTGAGITLRFA